MQRGDSAVGIVEAEGEEALPFLFQGEPVHVLEINAGFFEDGEDFGEATRFVRYLDGDNFGDFDHEALFFEELLCLLPIADDEAQDAELLSIGNGESEDVDFGFGESFDGAAERAGLVFEEQGELFNFQRLSGFYMLR